MIGTFIEWEVANPGQRRGFPPGWIVAENGCHIWTGARSADGYGVVRVDGRTRFVHLVRYEREVGPVPEGMELDHFRCDAGPDACCNPLHCRPVSHRENMLRGDTVAAASAARTHCAKGHELSGTNLVPSKLRRGVRECRTCCTARKTAWKRRRREQGTARACDILFPRGLR